MARKPSPLAAASNPRIGAPVYRTTVSADRAARPVVAPPRSVAVAPRGLTPAQMYAQNSQMMRAAGAGGLGQRTTPVARGDGGTAFNQMVRNNLVNQVRIENALGAPSTIPANLVGMLPPSLRPLNPAPAARPFGAQPPAVVPSPGAPGAASGGGATAAGGSAAAFGGGMNSILDAIRGGFAGQRSAVDEQLAAALGAQTGRRTAAGAARDEATAQLGRIVDDLISGAGAAGRRVGDVYSGGVSQIGQLMRDYEAMAGQRAAAGGRTLSAFGADASMAQPGGMGASDYLAAEAGALTGAGTVEGAYWGARPQAYQGLRSDIDTQRALAYEQLMGQIANQEQQLTAEAAGRRAQLSTEEQQAILEAQMRQWELQQQLAARSGGGGGGGTVSAAGGFMPIPDTFSLGI